MPDAEAGQPLLLLDKGLCLCERAVDLCREVGAIEYADLRAISLDTLRKIAVGVPQPSFPPDPRPAALPVLSPRYRRQIGMSDRLMSSLADLRAQEAERETADHR